MPAEQRYAALMKMPVEERRRVARAISAGDREQMMSDFSPKQREMLVETTMNPQQVVANEAMEAKLLRDIYSERQLEAVMTDFWFNHFNVFIGKGADHYMVSAYEREVIQPHALGKFKDLLEATAKSPGCVICPTTRCLGASVGVPGAGAAAGWPAGASPAPAGGAST